MAGLNKIVEEEGDVTVRLSQLDFKLINEKHEEVFNKFNSAPKINIASGFVLRNIETGEYR